MPEHPVVVRLPEKPLSPKFLLDAKDIGGVLFVCFLSFTEEKRLAFSRLFLLPFLWVFFSVFMSCCSTLHGVS